MEAKVVMATADFGRAKTVIGAQLDASHASPAVASAVWFLLSHEELYTWPEWRKVHGGLFHWPTNRPHTNPRHPLHLIRLQCLFDWGVCYSPVHFPGV